MGKHVTVNQMVAKDSIRSRMEGTDGISYTEFSYILLQAYDYWHLYEAEGCELQVGGSDQWGNITAGIDLIRRRTRPTSTGSPCHSSPGRTARSSARAWTVPCGSSAERTSPYRFFQYWMQVADADVKRFLLQLTLLPVPEAIRLAAEHGASPERRSGQRALARELTTLLHGRAAADAAEAASRVLFGGSADALSDEALDTLIGEVPTSPLARADVEAADLVDLLVATGLATSKGDARRSLAQRGISVNNRKVDADFSRDDEDILGGRAILLRKGKSTYHLISLKPG